MVSVVATFHRNGLIREFRYTGENIIDVQNEEYWKGTMTEFENICADLKRQGFRPLPYNPNKVVLTAEQKKTFTEIYGFEF